MLLRLVLVLLLTGCAARGPRTEEGPDPAILAADRAWERRGELGLGKVEEALLQAMERMESQDDPEIQWRYARLLVHRGMVEENDRRAALDSYAGARAQGMACLEHKPAWLQRRREAGLLTALEVLGEEDMTCLAWASLAWARWIALMGGDAAALDLDPVAAMANRVEGSADPALAGLGAWAGALVAASRPVDGASDRARKRLEKVFAQRPNDLVPHWDMLVFVAMPSGDEALIARERAAILESSSNMPTDEAVKARVDAGATE